MVAEFAAEAQAYLTERGLLGRTVQKVRVSDRAASLQTHGELRPCMGHHKKHEFELGGHRYVVSQCNTDRPAFILRYQAEGSSKQQLELVHFYVAMGLSRQHSIQQMCLARVRDFTIAHHIRGLQRVMFDHSRGTVSSLPRKDTDRGAVLAAWMQIAGQPESSPSRHARMFEEGIAVGLSSDAAGFNDVAP